MRNLFTRFLMIVFLSGFICQAYGAGQPVAPSLPPDVDNLWPEDQSTTQAQPGSGNVFVLEFAKDLNADFPFGEDGIFSLMRETESLGFEQVETIQYGVNGEMKVSKVGDRRVEIMFDASLLEDKTYHITIDENAIRFADGTFFQGVSYASATDPEWEFTVDDITPPVMDVCDDPNNVNGEFGVSVNQDPIVVCFSEPVSWADDADPMAIGNIAFYLASKGGLDPFDEYGGDVIYERPAAVYLFYNGVQVGSAADLQSSPGMQMPDFDKAVIYLEEPEYFDTSSPSKAQARGGNVWPENRDVYLRFAAGMLVDKAGNEFAGIHGSPKDQYAVSPNRYWFSTREDDGIIVDAWAVLENSSTMRSGDLWQNDDIVVSIGNSNLSFLDGSAINSGNVDDFIKLSYVSDGQNIPFSVNSISGSTLFSLEPGSLREKDSIKVEVLADQLHDKGDLRPVAYYMEKFATGDFSAPAIDASIENVLCTNFDIRVTTDEPGVVYYALIKEPAQPGKTRRVTQTDVVDGVATYWTGSTWAPLPLNNVADPDGGPFVFGNNSAIWQADSFNISPALTAFEHVDDFTAENHGDTYTLYYFALDKDAEGPYNSPAGISAGRVTGVMSMPVELTDCLEPELAWFFEGTDSKWKGCTSTALLDKNGSFKLDFTANPEGFKLVDVNHEWEDVIQLDVNPDATTDTSWVNGVEYTLNVNTTGDLVNYIEVIPLNAYPSGGEARVTLASGTVQDASGNAINSVLVCEHGVESYDDPLIEKLTVEYKSLMSNHESFTALNGVVAKKDGKITVEFNNPIYTPKRDEVPTVPELIPLSYDESATNFVGKYIKVREGDETTASVTDDVVTEIPFVYEMYNASGAKISAPNTEGVVKVVLIPQADYKSENWYYVDVEDELQDENRRELSFTDHIGTWDNNEFVDLHELYPPYPGDVPAVDLQDPSTWGTTGNMDNYYMIFRTEDTVAPELRFVFEKINAGFPVDPNPAMEWPYIEEMDSASVSCVDVEGITADGSFAPNGAPIAAIVTEWSTLGLPNDRDYYLNEDPNGLRPYFTMRNAAGDTLSFDVVVLRVFEPNTGTGNPYTEDAVRFGFIPFVQLEEGETYSMSFNPTYLAPQEGQEGIAAGPVFVDDNGNALVKNTYVEFTTCATEPPCFDGVIDIATTSVDGNETVADLTPGFTVTFDREFDDVDILNQAIGQPFFVLNGGGDQWECWDATLFQFNGTELTVPFEAFLAPGTFGSSYTPPYPTLMENTEYTLDMLSGGFADRNNETLRNCREVVTFYTPDLSAPVLASISPDSVANTGNYSGTDYWVDPRDPGKIEICWEEEVALAGGDKVVEVWQNGTTERISFTASDFSAANKSNTCWAAVLPVDFLQYNDTFHVDVEEGFFVDMSGNENEHLTGNKHSDSTWTFVTVADVAPEIIAWTPQCYTEPGETYSYTQPVSLTETEVAQFTVTLSEGVVPVEGKTLYVRRASDDLEVAKFDVFADTEMNTANGSKFWSYPTDGLLLENGVPYKIYVEEGAFVQDYPQNSTLATPSYIGSDFLQSTCDPVLTDATFVIEDKKAPTVTIWPEDGDVHVPFNAHGYIMFDETVRGVMGTDYLVVTQSNLKNWIKVEQDGTPLDASEYVCEFVNLERTHIRVTFLDEDAPSIGGVTANLEDETDYSIVVETTGDNGYALVDFAGNFLENAEFNEEEVSFTTEDITPPTFTVSTSGNTPSSIDVTINPDEDGKVYFVVRPAGTTVTAEQLFEGQLPDVMVKNVTTAGATFTWTMLGDVNLTTGYDYTVYAVMADDEEDVYVEEDFGDAWPTTEQIFVDAGDTDPGAGAVGLADIRPAPNKNMVVETMDFCFCDDDVPTVESKEWNEDENVPVDSHFEIIFDEYVQPGLADGDGQNPLGNWANPSGPGEIRLREWNNNVAVEIQVMGNGTGAGGRNGATGVIITPLDDLKPETRYYIEIDRMAIMDVPSENCDECSYGDETNYFPGWTGRYDWWFETSDETAPVLTSVFPTGSCVPVDNRSIIFTFTEKNNLVVNQLSGQASNIYIYKGVPSSLDAIPYEIISANATPVRRPGTNTWDVTYTSTHNFNSEETYYVLWNKQLFGDDALPTAHLYEESLSSVVDYSEDSGWQTFSFTAEDSKLPVVHYGFMNAMWANEFGAQYTYPLAIDSIDSNDPLSMPFDVCALYDVPQEVEFIVWFNETVNLSGLNGNTENNYFYLTNTITGGTVSLNLYSQGTASGDVTFNGGLVVPDGKQWVRLTPVTAQLVSEGEFEFGIKAGAITDVSAKGCRTNTLDKTKLFNFCVWDATPPTAKLYDGTEERIFDNDNCVAEGDYVRLEFSKPVVKTVDVVLPPQFGTPSGFNPWWTFENLQLTKADLMDTDGQIIRFQNMDNGQYVEVVDVEILEDGVNYKLILAEPLDSEADYDFQIHNDVLKDITRVPNGNFLSGITWDFDVTDWKAPYIVDLTPEDEETGVSTVASLEIEFNEDVELGTDARIIIRDNGDKQGVIYNFRADDSDHVTLMSDDQTVVVNHDGLDKNTTYYVEIEPGFVYEENCSHLDFPGLDEQALENGDWNFTTSDSDGPIATLWPTPGDECVPIDEELVITFDEDVYLTGDGQVVIYKVREGESWHNSSFGDVAEVIELSDDNYPQVRFSGTDAANGLTRNIITITPSANLWESDYEYYVRIVGNGIDADTEASVVEDVNENTWEYPVAHDFMTLLPGIHHNQWHFKIGNNDEPVLLGMTPEWGDVVPAGVASATTDLTMTFEDEVNFGSGEIKVYEFIEMPEGGVGAQQSQLWATYMVPEDVDAGKITISADLTEVTIHDVELLDGINWYYVIVDEGVITNNVECTNRAWSGIQNPDTWLFSTAPDVIIPTLDAEAVTSDACSEQYLEPATIAMELTFSENVCVANGTGLVEIVDEESNVVASATITQDMIMDNVISLSIADFTGMIEDQSSYSIVIGGDAIHDRATASMAGAQDPFGRVPFGNENWFAGVTIPFETGDFTAPTATMFAPMEIDLENDVTMTVTFDEAVQDGEGMFNLYDAVADTLVATFDAANDEDAVATTVTFSTMLPDEMSYYVTLDSGFVADMIYMDACDTVRGSNEMMDMVWTFSIDDNTAPYITEDLTPDTDNLMEDFVITLQYDDTITAVDVALAQLMSNGSAVNGVISAEIAEDPTQVIVSISAPADQTEYWLDLAAGFVMDDAINPNASEADKTGPYMVGDRTEPILEANGPSGVLGTYIGVEVFVDFFDDSELTVVDSFVIVNSASDTIAKWLPVLDEGQRASFMPALWFDTYDVIIPAGSVVDVNGNEFAGHNWNFVISDVTFDDACLTKASYTPADGDDCVTATPDLVIEFCEKIAAMATDKYVNVYELNSTGDNEAVAQILVADSMIMDSMIVIPLNAATILPDYNGGAGMLKDNQDYIVLVDEGAIHDEAGNAWVGISDPTVWNWTTGDNTAPEVTLMPATATNTENSITVLAQFNEPVMGAADAIMVEGAESFEVVMNATMDTATITIMAADMDTVMVTVPQSITDVNCNYNPLAVEVMGMYVVGDNTPPTVEVTDAPEDKDNTLNSFTVELTFSEVVMGVEEGLAGSVGLDSVMSDDHIVYTLYFSGADETMGSLMLVADSVTDVSENMNTLVEGITWEYMVGDHVAPTVEVDPAMGDDVRDEVLVLDLTFSEDVIIPDTGIVVTGGVAVLTGTGADYQLEITGEDGAEIMVELTSAITDDSQNANALEAVSFEYTFGDRTAPVVSADPETLMDAPLTFDVILTFDEMVAGVDETSVMVEGDGATVVLSTIVEGLAYKTTITGTDNDTITLSVTDAIMDLAGNALETTAFVYYTADETAPVATAMTPQGQVDATNPDFVITFDEDVMVSGSGSIVITASGDTESALEIAITEDMVDGNVLTVPYNAEGYAGLDSFTTYIVTVEEGIIADLSGNDWAGVSDDSWTFTTGDFPTGISPEFEAIEFAVYPNPFKDFIRIDNHDKLDRVVVSNIAGQRVLDIEYPSYEIRTGNLVTGVYVVTLISNDEIVKSERIIKR